MSPAEGADARGAGEATADVAALAAAVGDLRRRVEASESVLAIMELKARYGDLVDARFRLGTPIDATGLRRLAEEIAELFTEDA
ncbi:MAG TPA: hypothetical protein VMU09_01090, partial [Acidimicrobiales bacterium]|nr:hypothetical protein [Acidimicrobiales bacterium]